MEEEESNGTGSDGRAGTRNPDWNLGRLKEKLLMMAGLRPRAPTVQWPSSPHVWSRHWAHKCAVKILNIPKMPVKILTERTGVQTSVAPPPKIHGPFEQVDHFVPAHKNRDFFLIFFNLLILQCMYGLKCTAQCKLPLAVVAVGIDFEFGSDCLGSVRVMPVLETPAAAGTRATKRAETGSEVRSCEHLK